MGNLVLYVLEWALALLLLLGIYKAFFSGTTFHRFNRFYLLGATLLSALLPLVHITLSQSADLSIQNSPFAHELMGITVFSDPMPQAPAVQSHEPGHLLAWTLVAAYAVYVITLFVGWMRGITRTLRFLNRKPRRRISRTVWLVTHNESYGPFSWMNYIVISSTESGFARRASLRHEFSHIRLMHSVDLIILLACTILNPVCWLVLQEIKIVHEYEADDEVINRYGIREQDYQRLLIMKTVGAEAYALASSFNLNIKKRIIMMNKAKTFKGRLLWLLLAIPALGISTVLFASTDNKADKTVPAVELKDGDVIKGKVVDNDGPVFMADIYELDLNGRIMSHGISDIEGNFSMRLVNAKDLISVSKEGYEPFKGNIGSKELTITLRKTGEEEMVISEMPSFDGGMMGMMRFLSDNISYPEEAKRDSIQGRVLVSFVVSKEGKIQDVSIARSVHPLLDSEALKVVSMMPDWIPGKNEQGEAVNVSYTVPINFRITPEVRVKEIVIYYVDPEENDGEEFYGVVYGMEGTGENPYVKPDELQGAIDKLVNKEIDHFFVRDEEGVLDNIKLLFRSYSGLEVKYSSLTE